MRHVPVLLHETIESLALKPGSVVIDCTVGDAGHSQAMLEQIGPTGRLLALDADPESLLRAKQWLHPYAEQVTFVRTNFTALLQAAKEEGFLQADAVLMDFGWSTPQFQERNRGFSFQTKDEPLDMRYGAGNDGKQTAAEYLQEVDEEELTRVLFTYGEEKLSRQIAEAVVTTRQEKPCKTNGDLVELVLQVYRKKLNTDKEVPWIGGLHPATKTFQAIRIVVNDEYGVIESVLPQAIDVLKPGGRVGIISFHSGEDRIVKHFGKAHHNKTLTIVTKKPIMCGEQEYQENPPSRSAKLRVFQRIS